jgi:hypothetical protein
MRLQPYPICKGKKFKRKKLKKPISSKKTSLISNHLLDEKNKIKFINQLFRWVKKDSRHYKLYYCLKKKYIISNFDLIFLSVKIQKAGWKKLLLNLKYHQKNYKKLKRKSYSLIFIFFFLNIEDNFNKEITIDIKRKKYDIFNIFITLSSFYAEEFYNMINIYNKKLCKKKDYNDIILEELDYIFSWTRLEKIISYDVYMPWFLKKEDYCANDSINKRKLERKFKCIIKEKKLKSIFPLKKVSGYLIVTDKTKMKNYEDKRNLIFWKTIFHADLYKKKEDFFKVLKILLKRIRNQEKIDPTIVYFYIGYAND